MKLLEQGKAFLQLLVGLWQKQPNESTGVKKTTSGGSTVVFNWFSEGTVINVNQPGSSHDRTAGYLKLDQSDDEQGGA